MISYLKSTNGRIHAVNESEEGCWINVVNPTEDEVNLLVGEYEVEPEFIRAALDEEESSRIETEDGVTLIILDVPISEKQDDAVVYTTVPIGIVITPRHVITVSLNENPILSELANGVVKNTHTALKTQFVLHIMLRMALRYLQYLKQIDKLSSSVETNLRKAMRNKELIQLLDLEKSLVYFSTSLKADEITMEKLMRGRYLKLYEEDQDLLEDCLIEIKQAIEMSSIYLNILSGTMDAFASVISNNLNIVMKVLTSITILMAIPTIIFSFYGMNVQGLPFDISIWFPTGLALAATLITGFVLYKKDML